MTEEEFRTGKTSAPIAEPAPEIEAAAADEEIQAPVADPVEEKIATDKERYRVAQNALTAGVAMESNYRAAPTMPKYLRVGINAARADIASLVTLLMEKGVFTEAEYVAALADGMEREKARMEEMLSKDLGRKVILV